VDAREAPDYHRLAAEIARGHRGVLPARSFAVVLVADHHPGHALRLVGARDLREGDPALAGEHVEALTGLAGERVHGAEEHVVADPVEMAAIEQPPARGRDV